MMNFCIFIFFSFFSMMRLTFTDEPEKFFKNILLIYFKNRWTRDSARLNNFWNGNKSHWSKTKLFAFSSLLQKNEDQLVGIRMKLILVNGHYAKTFIDTFHKTIAKKLWKEKMKNKLGHEKSACCSICSLSREFICENFIMYIHLFIFIFAVELKRNLFELPKIEHGTML